MTTIGTANIDATPDPERGAINEGILALVKLSGENSRDHGFHEDWPAPGYPIVTATGQPAADVRPEWVEGYKTDLRRAIAEKLALIHEEVSEMLGEIRSGRDPQEIYFVDHKGAIGEKGAEYPVQAYGEAGRRFTFGEKRWTDDIPLLKPEGFLVEMADMFIRGGDLTYLVEGETQFMHALAVKHEYNATRPFKHGRKF